MTTTETKERTTVYLPTQLKQTVVLEAAAAGQPLSIYVERALAAHLQAKVAGQ